MLHHRLVSTAKLSVLDYIIYSGQDPQQRLTSVYFVLLGSETSPV